MIIPKIPKNQAQPACPVKAINPATPIATATPDQPLRFTLFPFLSILSYLQITKGLVDFKSIGSLNYTSQSVSDKRKTHEDASCVSSCFAPQSRGTAFNKKTPLFFFEEVGVFPNSANAELLLKAYIPRQSPNFKTASSVRSNLTKW